MSNKLFEIKFAEDQDISKVQLLRAGTYDYYGEDLEITASDLKHMKKNFDDNVKQVDLAIDYYHHSFSDAAGWIKEVVLENKNTELWVIVDWTEKGKKKILSKELRYLSVDFDPNYKDNETGEKFGITLNGGGLTNRPFVKGMNPILHELSGAIDKCPEKLDDIKRIISNNPKKEHIAMDFSELKKELVSINLSESDKKEIAHLVGIENNDKALSDKINTLNGDVKAKDEKIVELAEKLAKQEKEILFTDMVTNGEAVPAQKEAFLTNDVVAFSKAAVDINLGAKGTGKGKSNDEPKTFDDAQDKISELVSKKMSDDKELSYEQASSIVMNENPKLMEIMEAA